MDMSLYLSELPAKIRQAIIDNLPEGCRPDECDENCMSVYFCDEEFWPVAEDCPTSIIVTFKGFDRTVDRSKCTTVRYANFHVRYLTGCFPIDPSDNCKIEEATAHSIACGYFFECAIDSVTPTQTGLPDNHGPCDFIQITERTKCLLEGNCAGFETNIRLMIP